VEGNVYRCRCVENANLTAANWQEQPPSTIGSWGTYEVQVRAPRARDARVRRL
jgi:hypothetical protein